MTLATSSSHPKVQSFMHQLSCFQSVDKLTQTATHCFNGNTIPTYTNSFWSAEQRLGHSLHEISYRACFKPQLPQFLIEHLSEIGDTIYDPFMGRGTVALESALLQRRVLGNDINPLSTNLCSPRLSPPTLDEVADRLATISLEPKNLVDQELLAFYHPSSLSAITALKEYFLERTYTGTLDTIDAWIRMVATNRLTGHSPGFFSVYTLPPNQAVTIDRQRKINAQRKQTPEAKDIKKLILKKSKSLLAKLTDQERLDLHNCQSQFYTSDASNTAEITSDSVDLIITSPPFLNAVDYRTDNWLRCWFNGIDSHQLPISQLGSKSEWINKMSQVFNELRRVLKTNGVIAFEVGEIRQATVMLEDLVLEAAAHSDLQAHCIMINAQSFTKTANCWGTTKDKGTNTNRIVILTK